MEWASQRRGKFSFLSSVLVTWVDLFVKLPQTACSYDTRTFLYLPPPHCFLTPTSHSGSATQFFQKRVMLPSQGLCTYCSLCLQHCSPQISSALPPCLPSFLSPSPSQAPATFYTHMLACFLSALRAEGLVGSTAPALICMTIPGR